MTTEPVPVTIGGLEGQRLDVHLRPKRERCLRAGPLTVIRRTSDFSDIRLRALRARSSRRERCRAPSWSSKARSDAAEFDDFVADAMPIVETFVFDLDVAASSSPS